MNTIGPERRRLATIVDVAQHANVSVGTVSRYLNGIQIRQQKQQAIEDAIKVLRYSRNAAAKTMRTDRTNMVALLVPGYDEFFASILAGLTSSLAEAGQVLLTHKHEGDPRALALAIEFFQNHRVNAVITPGSRAVRPQIEGLIERNIPVVFFNNDLPELAVDRVFSKNMEGARDMVRHLVDLGHRRIGLIGGDLRETSAQERQSGYFAALDEAGIGHDPRLVVGGTWRRQDAYSGITRLMELDERPTAIFTANYVLAFAVLDYFREHGIQPGADISLASFDDIELFRQSSPGVTAVVQPAAAIGETISEIVLGHLTGLRPSHPRTITIDCNIILRQTTRPPKLR